MPQESLNINNEGKAVEMKSSPIIDSEFINKINSLTTSKIVKLYSDKYPEKAKKIEEAVQATNNVINLATYFNFKGKHFPSRA